MRLADAGFSAGAAAAFEELLARGAATLSRHSAEGPIAAWVVPGRIEVLGKHTDYGGGRSLLAAAERGFGIVARPRDDAELLVADARTGEKISFPLDPEMEPGSGWVNYPMTVARRVARNFPAARAGVSICFASNLPRAAGMSSSSALMIGVFLALAEANRLAESERYRENIGSPEDLAGYMATVENGRDFRALSGDRGVGTHGGSQDHTTILCARAGELVQYGFAPVRFERSVPMPREQVFVIASSGVRAEKTGAARERYNRAAARLAAAVEIWSAGEGGNAETLEAILDSGPGVRHRLRELLRTAAHPAFSVAELLDRVEQFEAESRQIIPAAGDALAAGDLERFGALVDRSQHLAETLLRNQIDETVFLARSAREAGATAASAFGAGFGGSVWALVDEASAEDFLRRWRAAYVGRFPGRAEEAEFFITRPGPAAVRLEPEFT